MTRRRFLELVGQVGGASALYGAMTAMGLIAAPTSAKGSQNWRALQAIAGRRRVVILGAGMSGLCAAYELRKAGYDVRVLEARSRVAGRAHTIRRGCVEVESDGRSQTCAFDEGEYFNCGATRIPQQHSTLDYCRELGVSIEQFGNLNESAYLYRDRKGPLSGKRVRLREARADIYGYVSELLAKAVTQNELDKRLTADDKTRLLQYLATEGGLSHGMVYRGNHRRGYSKWAGVDEGVSEDPYSLSDIVQSELGQYFSFNWGIEQQPIMFQIAGGTERLADAFVRQLGKELIELDACVTEIRQTPASVEISYTDRAGRPQKISGEFCICTIPLPVLEKIPADFSKPMLAAIAAVHYEPATKIALQFKRRFWEEDDRIFSGISRTDQSIGQIMYPSYNYLGRKGVVVGCYNFSGEAVSMGDLAPDARIERALSEGEKIHPQYRGEFENGISVAWHKSAFSRGAFSAYDPITRRVHYPTLREPDGRIYLAGEHISHLTGWMGGALDSARRVVTLIDDRAKRETPATRAS